MKKLLTVVTPFFARDSSSYLMDRAISFIRNSPTPNWLERIFVDQGSPELVASAVRSACEHHNIRYINLGKGELPFSIGACRNFAVQLAQGEFVSFQDVDLIGACELLPKLEEKLSDPQLPYNHLETIPCFYLTREASEKYLTLSPSIAAKWVYESYLEGDSSVIQMAAPATSCLVARRDFYLAEGGVRDEFFGHGYEDFELMNRMGYRSRRFVRPEVFLSHTHRYDSLEYRGYRTYFSMFGRQNLAEKIFYIHLYHETVEDKNYRARNAKNRQLFERLVREFEDTLDAPPALDDLNANDITLCIGSRNGLPFRGIRQAIPYLGRVIYRHETEFSSVEDLDQYIKENNISRLLFLTPYGNEARLNLYRWARGVEFPFVVFDRGAFPDSWFFDAGGFNSESSSYQPSNWRRELSPTERDSVDKYLHELCSSDVTLETNGDRVGAYEFRRRFNLLDKKVLFVPLQRPGDSVIKYLSGNVQGVEHFCDEISKTIRQLPSNWRVVVKAHPLEETSPAIDGAILLPSDTHVYDAISAADAVATINSGVGLLSLCFGKSVYCFGAAFYSHPGLARTVGSAEELRQSLTSGGSVDRESVREFVYFLRNRFYSYANTSYRIEKHEGGARSVAVHLDFYQIVLPWRDPVYLRHRTVEANASAPIYDYYRGYFARRISNSRVGATQGNVAGRVNRKTSVAANPHRSFSDRFNRKLRKFFKNPKLFFRDALLRRL